MKKYRAIGENIIIEAELVTHDMVDGYMVYNRKNYNIPFYIPKHLYSDTLAEEYCVIAWCMNTIHGVVNVTRYDFVVHMPNGKIIMDIASFYKKFEEV